MVHIFWSSVTATISLWLQRQLKKAKEARRFIKETIQSEREELDKLREKYIHLLNKKDGSSQ
jgi:hypothetical protein